MPGAEEPIHDNSGIRQSRRGLPYCRDMDASLSERLDAFSSATRYLNPGYQEAVDRLVRRLKAYDAGKAAPKPGEPMPPFAMPDPDFRKRVAIKDLLKALQDAQSRGEAGRKA